MGQGVDLRDLETRVKRLAEAFSPFCQELRLALRYIQPDPASSLTKSRVVFEKLLIGVYTAEMAREPRRPLIGDILSDNQFTRKIERRILSRMNTIRDSGNLGPHGEPVEPSDAVRVLDDLCEVLDWYLRRYGDNETPGDDVQAVTPIDRHPSGDEFELGPQEHGEKAGAGGRPKASHSAPPPEKRTPPPDCVRLWPEAMRQGELIAEVEYDDDERVRQLVAALTQDLLEREFSEEDCKKTGVALRELLTNLRHVPEAQKRARVRVRYEGHDLRIDIEDGGPGFDLATVLKELLAGLDAGDREHGLLRALRYGTELTQSPGPPHTIIWKRRRRPGGIPSLFDQAPNAVPIVMDYESELIRVVSDTYTFREFRRNFLTDGFLRLVFEPLRRTLAPYVGLEVRGRHHTITWGVHEFLIRLWRYRKRCLTQKEIVLFADTEPGDHDWLRALSEGRITEVVSVHLGAVDPELLEISTSGSLLFFEIPELCISFLAENGNGRHFKGGGRV